MILAYRAHHLGLSGGSIYRTIERAAIWRVVGRIIDRVPLVLAILLVIGLVVAPFIIRRVKGALRRTPEGGSTRGGRPRW